MSFEIVVSRFFTNELVYIYDKEEWSSISKELISEMMRELDI